MHSVADEMAKLITEYAKAKDYMAIYYHNRDGKWYRDELYHRWEHHREVVGKIWNHPETVLRTKDQLAMYMNDLRREDDYILVYFQSRTDEPPMMSKDDMLRDLDLNQVWFLRRKDEVDERKRRASDIIWTFLSK